VCIVKTPRVNPANAKAPEPTVIRNPYLDGMDPQSKALRKGRSSLRIERAAAGAKPPVAAIAPPQSQPFPIAGFIGRSVGSPVQGGGSGGSRDSTFNYNVRER
jgi:hypothetical protein